MKTEIIAYVITGAVTGLTFSIAVTPLFCILRKIFFVPFIRNKLLSEAEKKGHVIEAKLKKVYNVMNNDTDFGTCGTMEDVGVYSYQINGKMYKYKMISTTQLPEVIKLYYINKPRKATVAVDLGNWETPWFRIYIYISIVIAIVTVIVVITMG